MHQFDTATGATPTTARASVSQSRLGLRSVRVTSLVAVSAAFALLTVATGCHPHAEGAEANHPEHHKIVVTKPQVRDVVATQQYVCQIRSQRNIEVRALQEGYLERIPVKEGQAVKAGEVLFKIVPVLYKTKLDAELAEVRLAQLELDNTKRLLQQKVVSVQEVSLFEAKLAKAQARAAQAEAELNFTVVKAPYDGIIDRLQQQQGSLVKKEDLLTTLSDNSVMWVYFNVPEVRYLDYEAGRGQSKGTTLELADSRIELVLANGRTFNQHAGNVVTVEGKFNSETGNIPFRADFPNPVGLLRHGQTGNVLIHRTVHNAVVIPQRATFELLDKRYVFVVGNDHVAHQREIVVGHETDDIFVVTKGVGVEDKIVLEGVRQVRDDETVEFEYRKPEDALANQKHHAE